MKNNIALLIFVLVFSNTYSQVDSTKLQSETVNVFKSYEAKIQRAQQKDIAVEAPNKIKENVSYTYRLNTDIDVDFLREEPVIRPVSYVDDKKVIDDKKDGIIYGAYGNINTIKAGGAYQYYIEDWMAAGFQLDHHSNSTIQESNQFSPGISSTRAKLYASYFLNPKTKIGIEGHGTINKREAFLVPNINSDPSLIDLPYKSYGGTVNVSHTNFEKLGLAIRSKFSYDLARQEIISEIESNTNQSILVFDNNLYKKITKNISAETDFRIMHIGLSVSNTNSTTRTADYIVRPQIRFKQDKHSLRGGVELIRGGSENFIFPIVDLNIHNLYNGIDLRLFTESTYDRSDLSNYNRSNPYTVYNVNELRPVYEQHYNLLLSRQFNLFTPSLNIAYSRLINEIQFVNFRDIDVIRSSVFEVDYLDRNEFSVTPKVSHDSGLIDFEIFGTYHHFLNNEVEEILYTPQFEVGLKAAESLFGDKLSFTQQITYASVRYGRDSNGFISRLDPLIDISLTADFQVTRTFTVFGEAYNILNSSYEVWNGIDNYGRHFWGGLRVKF
jgi:hypothetical protein